MAVTLELQATDVTQENKNRVLFVKNLRIARSIGTLCTYSIRKTSGKIRIHTRRVSTFELANRYVMKTFAYTNVVQCIRLDIRGRFRFINDSITAIEP